VDFRRGTKPARRGAYPTELEQQVQAMATVGDDHQRITSLEASQREMQQLMAHLWRANKPSGNLAAGAMTVLAGATTVPR